MIYTDIKVFRYNMIAVWLLDNSSSKFLDGIPTDSNRIKIKIHMNIYELTKNIEISDWKKNIIKFTFFIIY